MKIELTALEYELLKAFQQLTKEEKTIVLASGRLLLSDQETLPYPDRKAV